MNGRRRARIVRLLPYAAVLPPLLAMGLLAIRYGATVPSVEQLQYVPIMRAVFLEHGWNVHNLFWQQPTSDHITFFPLLAELLWARLSGWNIGAELVLTPLLALFNAFLLLRFAGKLGGFPEPWRKTALAFTLGLLLFTGRQWSAWTWSMNSLFLFIPACCLLSLTLLSHERSGWKHFWIAAVICTVATFSFGNGIATWFSALPLLVLDWREPRRRLRLPLWLLVAGGCAALYLSQYHSPGTVELLPAGLRASWIHISEFFCVLWGQQLIAQEDVAVWLGRLVLALGIVLLCQLPRKGQHGRISAALWGAFVFTGVSAVLIAWSRVTLGLHFALESRYGGVMAVGLGVTAMLLLRKLNPLWTALLASALLLLWLNGFADDVRFAFGQHSLLTRGKACLETYAIASDDCLGILYFNQGPYVREQAKTLEELGYLQRWAPPADMRWERADSGAGLFESMSNRSWGHPSWYAQGWAARPGCTDVKILLTAGPEHRLVGVTYALQGHPEMARPFTGCPALGWSLVLNDDVMRTVSPKTLEAWIYDEAEHRALRLPRKF
ncbi:MAG TPA: hypothetical protein PKV72_04240 [Candidatus Peribacteria bacterium]|nr:hypothetical protein [Candidatus Peribacteria bacterium]